MKLFNVHFLLTEFHWDNIMREKGVNSEQSQS